MSILQVTNLSHNYGGREILRDVNFRLLNGEHVGLIGPNGEGKSSFLNIITGKLQPDVGEIKWAKRVRVGYLDQHSYLKEDMTIRDVLKDAFAYLFDIEREIEESYAEMVNVDEDKMNALLEEVGTLQDILEHHDFYLIDAKIDEVSSAMGVDALGLDNPVNGLSGGQRSKVLLCKLLLEKPDILLLDEPTNYLDEEHIEWLRRYLKEYENAFILISHDISFLNSVINLIYHVENMELNRYVGDYDDFLRLHEEKQRQLKAAYNRQQQEISQLKDFVARNKARVATRNMAMSRQKKLDKMDIIELPREKAKPEFRFLTKSAPGKLIFETKDLVIGYDSPLTKPLNLRMERGQRIAVIGENGLGKTTLIKTLLGLIPPISGNIENGQNIDFGYFEQEDSSDGSRTAIDELWDEYPSHTQASIRSMLAKCGLTTENMEVLVRVLSGGERSKLRLCKILNRPTNVLVLDEPTNHLDPKAKEELKRALKEYKGGIFLISHEKDFYEEVSNEIWKMSDFI
ncbi:ABC-F family ATP-binding cassette domain-containing protein [Microaceticoccus formicicus]|uniref:ABC-F family ATP-binding cassette domain-containing protein n=1 Tax=Microaceticoccus formicicus TaxID=3118105 RepID=UPI003CD03218|nr:ABC-F family ATP-binding cassette domain-containing protein [Peptoniphilaceae bacterium AMB_02]